MQVIRHHGGPQSAIPRRSFNVLNKTNFQAAGSNISTSTFGTITKTFPSRQIQLALKYTF
jgi:hypothetical protein